MRYLDRAVHSKNLPFYGEDWLRSVLRGHLENIDDWLYVASPKPLYMVRYEDIRNYGAGSGSLDGYEEGIQGFGYCNQPEQMTRYFR